MGEMPLTSGISLAGVLGGENPNRRWGKLPAQNGAGVSASPSACGDTRRWVAPNLGASESNRCYAVRGKPSIPALVSLGLLLGPLVVIVSVTFDGSKMHTVYAWRPNEEVSTVRADFCLRKYLWVNYIARLRPCIRLRGNPYSGRVSRDLECHEHSQKHPLNRAFRTAQNGREAALKLLPTHLRRKLDGALYEI